jgi:hypothetical protein
MVACASHHIVPTYRPCCHLYLLFQAALDGREAALTQAEQLRGENAELSRRLVSMKEAEIERMNEINSMHADMVSQCLQGMRPDSSKAQTWRFRLWLILLPLLVHLTTHSLSLPAVLAPQLQQAAALKEEARAEKEAAELIRQKAATMAAAAVRGPAPITPQPAPAASTAPASVTAAIGAVAAAFGAVRGDVSRSSGGAPATSPQKGHQQETPLQVAGSPGGQAPPSFDLQANTAASVGAVQGAGTGLVQQAGAVAQPAASPSRASSDASASPYTQAAIVHSAGLPVGASASAPAPTASSTPTPTISLKELMGLPAGGSSSDPSSDFDRKLPKAVTRSLAVHRGGACALAAQTPGEPVVSPAACQAQQWRHFQMIQRTYVAAYHTGYQNSLLMLGEHSMHMQGICLHLLAWTAVSRCGTCTGEGGHEVKSGW